MTTYNVHIYREMRLVFGGIEAESPEAAASIARDKPTEDADSIDDCEGQTMSALVDARGDEEYEHSQLIDFEEERLRKAAQRMLTALRVFIEADALAEECGEWKWENLEPAFQSAREAITEAEAAVNACEGIPTPELERGILRDLLAALTGILGESDYDATGRCRGCGREREDDRFNHCAIDDDVEDCPFGFARAVIARLPLTAANANHD